MKKKKEQIQISELHSLISFDILRNNQDILSVGNIYFDCHSEDADAMDRRSLNALVKGISPEDLLEAVHTYIKDGYNRFNLNKVENIIKALIGEIPEGDKEAAHDFCRKQLKDYEFSFGRESSPVLYIKPKHRMWLSELIELEKVSNCDEIYVENDGTIRLWWD